MNEQCHVSTIRGCPYLDEHEIDDIQGCKLACLHPETGNALMPESCPLDVRAEIKARGDEVLELAEKLAERLAYAHQLYIELRQAYHEKYGE